MGARTNSLATFMALATAATIPAVTPAAEEQCPIKWHTLKKGLAEATSRNRPIVMVFTQGGSGLQGITRDTPF